MTDTRYKELMANAMKKIGDLQTQLKQKDAETKEPIAIIGMGCRFPGGSDHPDLFWQNLMENRDNLGEVPQDRWDSSFFFDKDGKAVGHLYLKQACFLEDVFGFDPKFFGISPREAQLMDPQQRLLLETIWQTFENAGLCLDGVKGSATGTFIGSMNYDFLQATHDPKATDVHSATGVALSVLSGRISHQFDFKGPALTVDTACSSSLVALHLGCRALRSGECDMSLVGGVNVITYPTMSAAESAANMLSPDGRCKTFDDSANGYGRGEGCGVVLLKRLSDALRDGDEITAVIKGTATNHDGQSSALTVPNVKAQIDVIQRALKDADVKPSDISYVETHGTGTSLGDPIEIEGLNSAYGKGRGAENPLLVGAVKSNIGHLEGAAGIAGVIKAALMLKHCEIPPHRYVDNPNKYIDWDNSLVQLPSAFDLNKQALLGVSSFGFSGTNAHAILETSPTRPEQVEVTKRPSHIAVFSAKTKTALHTQLLSMSEYLSTHDDFSIEEICCNLNRMRTAFEYRVAFKVTDVADLRNQLKSKDFEVVEASADVPYRVVMNFSHFDKVDDELNSYLPKYREILEECLAFAQGIEESRDKVEPFAHQYALVKTLEVLGIHASSVRGVGQGEYVAGCVAGVMSWQDAIRLILGHEIQEGLHQPVLDYESANTVTPEVQKSEYWVELAQGVEDEKPQTDRLEISAQKTWDSFLDDVMELYQQGCTLDWSVLYNRANMRVLNLPSYPFERKEFKFETAYNQVQHVLLGKKTSDLAWCKSDISGQNPWLLDHKIAGHSVYPGVAYLEMVLQAAQQAFKTSSFQIDEIEFLRPFVLSSDATFELFTRFNKGYDEYLFDVYGKEDDEQEIVYCQGRLYEHEPKSPNSKIDIEAHKVGTNLSHAEFYENWDARGNVWAGQFRLVQEVWLQDHTLFAKIQNDGLGKGFYTHPQIMDACGHAVAAFAQNTELEGNFVVKKLSGVSVFKPLQGRVFYTRAVLKTDTTDQRLLQARVEIYDEQGDLLVCVENCAFQFMDVKIDQNSRALEHDLYDVQWVKAQNQSGENSKEWCVLVSNPQDQSTVSAEKRVLFEDLKDRLAKKPDLVIFDARPCSFEKPATYIKELQETLSLISGTKAKLFFMTQGAYGDAPEQAMNWGLARSFAAEYQNHFAGICDSEDQLTDSLCSKLSTFEQPDQLRLIEGEILSARLAPKKVTSEPLKFKEDKAYLITGGLGGLGLEIARFMVTKGARHLVLCSRSAQVKNVAQKRLIQEMNDQGVVVDLVALDVSDQAALKKWVNEFNGEIKGIVHGAGTAERLYFKDIDQAKLDAHLRAKYWGAKALDECLDLQNLDFFISLSSVSGLINSPEFGAYAAANASVDGLMQVWRKKGVQAKSVAWGPWRDVGMAADSFAQDFKVMDSVTTDDALSVLEKIWNDPCDYVAIIPTNWSVWPQKYPNLAKSTLLSDVIDQSENNNLHKNATEINFLEVKSETRASVLQDWLHREIARIFNFNQDDLSLTDSLGAQGMDSLMAVEIKNAVESKLCLILEVVELMEGISIVELADRLALQVSGQQEQESERPLVTPTETRFELTHGQKSLWLIQELDHSTVSYNVGFAVQFKETIDPEKIQGYWHDIVSRHSALRSVFETQNNVPYQIIKDTPEFGFDYQENGDTQALLQQAYEQPFDLKTGPLFRVHIVNNAMLIVAHHVICDGWSLWCLLDEFAGLCQGDQLSAPVSHYQAFAKNLQTMLDSAQGQEHWAFWQEKLKGDLPVLALPHDHQRGTVQSFEGATFNFRLDQEITKRLHDFAKSQGVTQYTLLLAIYNVLLHRYSAQDDILVGCPTTGRNRSEYGEVIGHFVNPVVMRSDLRGTPRFTEFLAQTKQTVLEALKHQEYPFSLLVEQLSSARETGISPIFQTDFTLQKAHKSKELIDLMVADDETEAHSVKWGEYCVEPLEINQQEGQFDLSFEMLESNAAYFCSLKYSTDLFEAATIERMAQHFECLVQNILEEPEQTIQDLDMIPDVEKKLILEEFNNTAVSTYPLDTSIAHLFEEQVAKTPDKIAVMSKENSLSYAQLNAQANQIARVLRNIGVKANDFVGILDTRSADFLAAILGIMKAGAAYIPIDPDYPDDRVRYMIENSEVEILISRSEFVEKITEAGELSHLVLQDDVTCEIDGLKVLNAQDLEQEICDNLDLITTGSDRAYMIYTSGSTGQPKGAIVRHNGAINHMFAEFHALEFHENSRFLQSAPSSSDISVWQFLGPLMLGGATIIADFETICDVPLLFDLIKREKVTIIELVPIVLDSLLAHLDSDEGLALPDLEWGMVTGEAASVSLVNRWFDVMDNVALVNAYGPTEAADDVCQHVMHEPLPITQHQVPIGRPLGNLNLHILDEHQDILPIGVRGEICVSGIGVGEGYWKNPEKTASAFVANPYARSAEHAMLYRSGDQGRWRADGTIEYLGRDDDQIKIRGFRIETGEIENSLMSHTLVRQALVVVQEDKTLGKSLVAYLIGEEGREVNDTELRDYLVQNLPSHMIPAGFVWLENYPQLPNGKVDKKSLPLPNFETGISQQTQAEGSAQQKLVEIWKDVLGRDAIGIHDNFFELGGHSMLMAKAHRLVQKAFAKEFGLVLMFQYPTVASLANYLDPKAEAKKPKAKPQNVQSEDIAVIGMGCRFAGADSVEEFWHNIRNKVESVRFFSDEELAAKDVEEEKYSDPAYVKGCAVLENLDQFDANFFGYNAREAEIMDPQQRLFLECAWETMEHAGYSPDQSQDRIIGCFAGSGATAYLNNNIHPNLDDVENAYLYQVEISNDKDYLATTTGYKLNLQGPCVSVQTACSTSLAAIHMACKSIQAGECEMALAGSVTANVLHQSGYLYQDGMILSPDGHCRPFDERAKGTIPGSGLGVLMLKGLEQARLDGDVIHGVIKGSAINNDGSLKAGFTAPSVDGQVSVIQKAYENANVDPSTVGYIGAHGTATPLGDPIEISALTQAFSHRDDPCAISSVKANIGHTDTAAGVASVICALMAMKHKELPPQLNYETPNPVLELGSSPFEIYREAQAWEAKQHPRRAGVSSLGIGGTNVHVVLEEAPERERPKPQDNAQFRFYPVSAQSKKALKSNAKQLGTYLEGREDISLPDVSLTLVEGRNAFDRRAGYVANTVQGLSKALLAENSKQKVSGKRREKPLNVTFMFSGQGAQYAAMGLGLYERYEVFKDHFVEALNEFSRHLDLDLWVIWRNGESVDGKIKINETLVAQPLLFSLEYAMANLVQSAGITPQSFIGHSIGEYVAATLAGVFTLKEACLLVSKRAQLMQILPTGAMCAVPLSKEELSPYLSDEINLAAVNSSNLCVLSGSFEAMDELEERLKKDGKSARRLHTSHAFHSYMMEGAREEFLDCVKSIDLKPAKTQFISNLTGTWITDEQACDPEYWYRHLRHEVSFSEGLSELFKDDDCVLLELGPGNALSTFALQHDDKAGEHTVLSCLPTVYEKRDADESVLQSLGKLWTLGANLDWQMLNQTEGAKRVELPTYCFDRQSYWMSPRPNKSTSKPTLPADKKIKDIGKWFSTPSWERQALSKEHPMSVDKNWLVFVDDTGLGKRVCEQLLTLGAKVIQVRKASIYQEISEDAYDLDPTSAKDFTKLFDQVGGHIDAVINFWGLDDVPCSWTDQPDAHLDSQFASLFHMVKELGRTHQGREIIFKNIVQDTQDVTGTEKINPILSSLIPVTKVLAQEYPTIHSQTIDLGRETLDSPRVVEQIVNELHYHANERLVAYRGKFRWVQVFEPDELSATFETSGLKEHGVYLITGGLGYLGLLFARYLAKTYQAKLVLLSRREMSEGIAAQVDELKTLGAEVWVAQGDMTDVKRLKEIVEESIQRFGGLDGVLHAAGVTDQDFPIEELTYEICQKHWAPKVHGTMALDQALDGVELDFVCLFSSLSSVLGGLRFAPYGAVNACMDSYVIRRNRQSGTQWTSICWDGWKGTDEEATNLQARDEFTITETEGVQAFERILSREETADQVIVSVTPLQPRVEKWITNKRATPVEGGEEEGETLYERPDLDVAYIAPETDHHVRMCAIWQSLLGIKDIGIDDNFFELGGHSLLGTQLITRLRQEFQIQINIGSLFDHPTISALSELVENLEQGEEQGHAQADDTREEFVI